MHCPNCSLKHPDHTKQCSQCGLTFEDWGADWDENNVSTISKSDLINKGFPALAVAILIIFSAFKLIMPEGRHKMTPAERAADEALIVAIRNKQKNTIMTSRENGLSGDETMVLVMDDERLRLCIKHMRERGKSENEIVDQCIN